MSLRDFCIKMYRYKSGASSQKIYLLENWTGDVKTLSFSTKNPGGFASCSLRIDMPFNRALDIHAKYLHCHMVITRLGVTAWEGRIEEITAEPDQVTMTAYGLWSNAYDTYYDDGSLEPIPIAENPIINRDGWAFFWGGAKQYAQSFKVTEARALQDVQVRLANFGVAEGTITVEIRESSETGTVMGENTIQAKSILDNEGFSEYIGITGDERLDTAITYYIVIRPDGEYFSSVTNITGTHTGSSSLGYLVDGTKCWLAEKIKVGAPVANTTQTYIVHVASSELVLLANPGTIHLYDDSAGTYTDISANLKDNNPGTEYTFSNFDYSVDWIYIGFVDSFDGLYLDTGTSPQSLATESYVEYWNGAGWRSVEELTDNTVSDGASFYTDGSVRWAKPSDAADCNPHPSMGDRRYCRVRFTGPVDTSFTLAEIDIGRNTRLNFSDMGTNDWDTSDAYNSTVGVALGLDNGGNNYTDGKLRYHNGTSWGDFYTTDGIFYIWGHPKFYYSTGAATYASGVIEDVISECHFINDATIYFDDDGRVCNPIRFTDEEKHGQVIETVLSFGSSDSTPVPLAFGVWEDGYAHLKKITDGREWYLYFKSLPLGQQALAVTKNLSGYRTKIAGLYSDEENARGITAWVENDNIYDMFGYHREAIFSMSGVDETLAEVITDMIADVYKTPTNSIDILVEGSVVDEAHVKWPAWMVRAGDVLHLDLFPSSAVFDVGMEDRLVTLYVKETDYDASTSRLRITSSDLTKDMLDMILSLSGVSGATIV